MTVGEWLSYLSGLSNVSALEHFSGIKILQSAGNCVNADIITNGNSVPIAISNKPSIELKPKASIQFNM